MSVLFSNNVWYNIRVYIREIFIIGGFILKKIYIMLTRSETILSRIVHLVTADSYTHASLAFEDDKFTFYSSSRKNGRTLFPAGPCCEHLSRGYFARHPQIPCKIYELEVDNEIYDRAKNMAREFTMNQNLRFNIIGLLLCRFNIKFSRYNHFFCSQFVGDILNRSEAMALPKHPTLMRPADYMRLPALACRYTGTIRGLRLKYRA